MGHFPRIGRVRALLHLENSQNREALKCRVEQHLSTAKWGEWIIKRFHNFSGDKKQLAVESYTSDLYDFYLLGMKELPELFLELADYDPQTAHNLCSDYSDFLVKPLFETLEGVNSFLSKDLKSARELFLSAAVVKQKYFENNPKLVNGIKSYMGINPSEFIQLFETRLNISLPSNVSHYEQFCEHLESEEDVRHFKESLRSIVGNNLNPNSISELAETSANISRFIERDIKRLDNYARH